MSRTDWSQAEDRKLARMWLAAMPPLTTREIAEELDRSKSAVYRRIRTLDMDGHKGDRDLYEQMRGVSLEPAIKPVRVETDVRPTGESVGAEYTELLWGDVHIPFQDPEAVDVLKQIAAYESPERLTCLGDVFDFHSISNHRKPKNVGIGEFDVQETITEGVRHLGEMLECAEPDEAVFLGGNHEDRWDRLLLKTRDDIKLRQLLKIPRIRQALQFEEIVGFEDLGYEYRPYKEAGKPVVRHDMLVETHGHKANKYVGRTMLEEYGLNVIFGHKHQIQVWTRRDLKGQEAGWCVGCLCDLDPHYTDGHTDWHHGFAVIDWALTQDGWRFDVQIVRIHDGVAVHDGKVFEARS